MATFNKSFYTSNNEATLQHAENRLIALGYKNFSFKSVSRTHGVSFYFHSENGEEIRVSDHRLTGKRAFNTIQIDLFEIKTLPRRQNVEIKSDSSFIERMMAKREAKLQSNK